MALIYTTAEITLNLSLVADVNAEAFAIQQFLRDAESEVVRDLEVGWDTDTGRVFITAKAEGRDFFDAQRIVQDGLRFSLDRYAAGRGEIFRWALVTSWDEDDDLGEDALDEFKLGEDI